MFFFPMFSLERIIETVSLSGWRIFDGIRLQETREIVLKGSFFFIILLFYPAVIVDASWNKERLRKKGKLKKKGEEVTQETLYLKLTCMGIAGLVFLAVQAISFFVQVGALKDDMKFGVTSGSINYGWLISLVCYLLIAGISLISMLKLKFDNDEAQKPSKVKQIIGVIIPIAIFTVVALAIDWVMLDDSPGNNDRPDHSQTEDIGSINANTDINNESFSLGNVFISENDGITFNYPNDWKASGGLNEYIGEVAEIYSHDKTTVMIIARVSMLPGESIFEFSEAEIIEELLFYFEEIKNIEMSNIQIDGVTSKKVIVTGESDGISATQMLYFYHIEQEHFNYFYALSFTAFGNDFIEYKPTFDAIMETYRIAQGDRASVSSNNNNNCVMCGKQGDLCASCNWCIDCDYFDRCRRCEYGQDCCIC
jgi:hypothetical protein